MPMLAEYATEINLDNEAVSVDSFASDQQCSFVMDKGIRVKTQRGKKGDTQ